MKFNINFQKTNSIPVLKRFLLSHRDKAPNHISKSAAVFLLKKLEMKLELKLLILNANHTSPVCYGL